MGIAILAGAGQLSGVSAVVTGLIAACRRRVEFTRWLQ